MLIVSKWLFIITGLSFIIDGILIVLGKRNPVNPEWGLPCPLVFMLFGLAVFLFALGSNAFDVIPVLYPAFLDRYLQVILWSFVIVLHIVVYGRVISKRFKSKKEADNP